MSTEADIVERIEAERTARADDPLRPANPLLREAAAEITKLRAERDAVALEATHLRDAFLPFVTSSTLNPCEWAKVLNQKYSGLKPITVTVTKFQYQAACRALPSTVIATERGGETTNG